jgi:ATP-dependent RNA helicase DDX46/PRP5
MARPGDSRSPSPAGSQRNARRHRKDDDRRDKDRRDDTRDYHRRTRSRSPPDVRRPSGRYDSDFSNLNHSQRRNRDRDRERIRDRDRGARDRDRDNNYRRRDRSIDRRDDDYYRGSRRDAGTQRDRRRSRERFGDRDRSPERRRHRSRDGDRDHRARRDDSRDRGRGRREGTADSHTRNSRADENRPRGTAAGESPISTGKEVQSQSALGYFLDANVHLQSAKPATASPAQCDADKKKADRLARLEAWKKKKESEGSKEKEVNPSQTRRLLAEMDEKASGSPKVASPAVVSDSASPATLSGSGPASPAAPYQGKFDPKAIAKKSAASRLLSPTGTAWGSINGAAVDSTTAPVKQLPAGESSYRKQINYPSNTSLVASALPANRGNLSSFGFHKPTAEAEKLASKRKLDLDEEDTTKRKLTKLPVLLETDDTPYADQDDDDESDGDNFAENEEEALAAARAAHERREERIMNENNTESGEVIMTDAPEPENPTSEPPAPIEAPVAEPNPAPAAEEMEVDHADVDPLDAFMAELGQSEPKTSFRTENSVKKAPEPEAYFSDDDFFKEGGGDSNSLLNITAKRKKKDIPTIDYTKLELKPIRKNFWVEPAELSSLTETETNDLRLELDDIKVSGKDVPKPVQKWAQCGLTRQTLDIIEGLGFEKPTPIQMQALPAIMSGRDVVGVAKTGSGKTVAFLLPMFRHIKDQEPLKDNDGPISLIMTPTRELATQIHRDCKAFLKSMNLRSVCAYGGAPIRDQIAELKRGAEIIVCTPGRMIDLLAANQGRVTNLKRVTYVVLDEADRMFDMGFEPQVMKIFATMRPDRQTILFSATMPRIIDSLTKKVLKEPIEIEVGGRSVVASDITQIVEIREESAKFLRLLELLGELYDADEDARSLIFVERQEKADDLLKELMLKGYPCMSIHGGKDQIDRDSTIADFKKGVIPILIATSVAARGLDVKQLKLVVNYDAPNHLEDYVHRVGRTGRAGNKGTAVTFVTEKQENCAPGIAKALEQSGQPIPERLNEMRKSFREQVKAGKAKDTSGFGGKGLDRLDQEREAARLRERKTHKAEGEEEDFKDEKTEEDKTQKATSAIFSAASAIVSRDAAKAEAEAKAAQRPAEPPSTGAGADKPLEKVSAAISAINQRLGKAGQLRSGQPIDNKGPDAGAFHATLEINDFPQKARWAVTNRTNVAKILEATGTSITTKGTFYAAGKEVPAGADPKLYILVEGDTEVVVGAAMAELTRLLRDGTMAAADAESRAPASGRYTVT